MTVRLGSMGTVALLAALAACGDSGKGTGPAGGLTLETRAAASRRIGLKADTITAVSGAGVRYSLGFDSGSVLDTVTVRVTPVAAAATGPLHDAHLVAAVRMEPSGTVFAHPAQLTIELPAGADSSRLAGFIADGDGASPHLVPVRVAGSRATLLVPHFSVAGLVDDASQIPPPRRARARRRPRPTWRATSRRWWTPASCRSPTR